NPFRIKMAFLCVAILFHLGVLRRLVRSDPGSRPRLVNIIVACLSLTVWFCVGWAGRAMWQQSENVVFEQSRNVVLTAPSFGDAGRTTTDDSSRKRPAGGIEEGQ